jgi:gluconolactonase
MQRRIILNSIFLFAAGCFVMLACQPQKTSFKKVGEIIRQSERINELVSSDAQIEKLGEGFIWSEGPVWISEGGYLLFTDVPGNTLYKWTANEGVTVFLKPSGYAGDDTSFLREGGANGLALDKDGHLILCDSGNRAIVSLDLSTKTKTVLVDSYQGKRLNSPNDLVIHSSGDIYFTDPPYGLKDLNDSPRKELAFNGVYRFSRDGAITMLTDEFTFPNGVALAPDEKTLYVAQSDPQKPILMAYDLMDDGSIAHGRILFDFSELAKQGKPGLPDGMAIDVHGNLFVTGPGGVHVITPDGLHWGTIATGQAVANCAFGNDGSVLYLTSDMMLCRVQLKTKGMYF